MSRVTLVRILDRWKGLRERDLDAALLQQFLKNRDEEAFAGLVQRHGPLVYGTCRRVLGNGTDVDDAFQAVFFVLARRAQTLKRDRTIGPWLHGVALRVAMKLRTQTVRRRLREMTAARSERVEAMEPERDFWAIVDEELARLPLPLREVVVQCDLGGQSHAQAGQALGVAKGTVTKRLAKAHEELARRLNRRGIGLSVAALSAVVAQQATAAVPPTLLQETAKQAMVFPGVGVGSLVAKTLAESFMRSRKIILLKTWFLLGLIALATLGGGFMLAGGPTDPPEKKPDPPKVGSGRGAGDTGTMLQESHVVEYPGRLPVSVAFAPDAKTVITGDTNGEVMALIFAGDAMHYRWKTKVGGTHAAVAYSADQKKIYATTEHGVRVLDAATGEEQDLIEAQNSNPTALAVFPNKTFAADHVRSQVVFGNAGGYFVKSWADGKLKDTVGSIETSTGQTGQPAAAVPLAVDPKGRSAIMIGPRDGTGEVTGTKDKNVLWAYVCGDYEKGSPGNRVMTGHNGTVGAAAWAKLGDVAATGDSDGRVIFWDAATMKESRRVQLGGRVLALALSDDGKQTAAYVWTKQGVELFTWPTAQAANGMKPIHTELGDFKLTPFASLSFSPDGKQLAGCAGDKLWLNRSGRLIGKVRVWQVASEPKAQLPPKQLYVQPLPKGNLAKVAIVTNETMLVPATERGAIDKRRVVDGQIQARRVFDNFTIGGMKLSSDRKWLALEQHHKTDENATGTPPRTFDVGIYESFLQHKTTIPACRQFLDIASGGEVVAVVRDKLIELWEVATPKMLQSAPFQHTEIDAVSFSPDGKLLAISDRNTLVLWRWQDNMHERIDLGRCVGSLTFSPDGRYLAEGPSPRASLQIRDVATGKVVQTLVNGTKQMMDVPRLAYLPGGRVLIACDDVLLAKEIAVPHRINLWDTGTGALAQQLAVPAGIPVTFDVSPNGRNLVAMLDDGENGMKLCGWRLDGQSPAPESGSAPPAAGKP